MKNEKGEKHAVIPVSFSTVLDKLPSNISQEALPNISVPYCFICLLHLANEKGLNIAQEKNNLTELFISKPRTSQ